MLRSGTRLIATAWTETERFCGYDEELVLHCHHIHRFVISSRCCLDSNFFVQRCCPHPYRCQRLTWLPSHAGQLTRLIAYFVSLHLSLLPPLLRAFNSLQPSTPSPLAPPLNHIIHSLLAVPFTKNLQTTWLPPNNRGRHGSPPAGHTSPISPSSSLASDSPREAHRPQGAFDYAKFMFTAGREIDGKTGHVVQHRGRSHSRSPC